MNPNIIAYRVVWGESHDAIAQRVNVAIYEGSWQPFGQIVVAGAGSYLQALVQYDHDWKPREAQDRARMRKAQLADLEVSGASGAPAPVPAEPLSA